ncbi:STAS-like domain-containing protein [Desulfobacula sp.]|uniref:STAS-like domain-containing protein n=1 Tax=Desulfobacula sp. TaxID=2593537 RepID=UPI002615CFF7|nr:STAS-like domain-containing protein [Desulfobacula sp.]
MKFTKEVIWTIKNFILDNIETHPNDIVQIASDYFRVSKPTILKYIRELISQKQIERHGNGRYPNYKLQTVKFEFKYKNKELQEDVLWANDISNKLKDVQPNVKEICQYGFTEIVNNVIDHSGSEDLTVFFEINHKLICITVRDFGVGIFNKIKQDLGLSDPKHSILELAKGKFTSDPDNHTGEGIFFSSRMFDHFHILSHKLSYFGQGNEDGWLFEDPDDVDIDGTVVLMKIRKDSEIKMNEIFNEFADPDKTPGFHRTKIPVELMQHEGELLLSRSQAKRLITRFDKFLEVVLDFKGVTQIGQAFADQVFRVFKNAHPNIHLIPVNMNENVRRMVERIQKGT